jgi:hypothetical protein
MQWYAFILDILNVAKILKLITAVCKKPIHTVRYLYFQSNHPLLVEKEIVRNLYKGFLLTTKDKMIL